MNEPIMIITATHGCESCENDEFEVYIDDVRYYVCTGCGERYEEDEMDPEDVID